MVVLCSNREAVIRLTLPRLRMRFRLSLCALFVALLLADGVTLAESRAGDSLQLASGWRLQSRCRSQGDGPAISGLGFDVSNWLTTKVPSTVLAAQISAGEFKGQWGDPYFGMNLRDVPGTSYPIPKLYVNMPIASDSPYKCSWWYRTEFTVPANWKAKTTWLHFDGINYRANIWVNGTRLADSTQIAGAYRTYDLPVGQMLKSGPNVLVVEVFAQTETDLGINFVDWNPTPPDRSMGIWRPVYLRATGPVRVEHPAVRTHFTDATLDRAELGVVVDLQNASSEAVEGTLMATLAGVGPWGTTLQLRRTIKLAAGEHQTVDFTPEDSPALRVKSPALWWPYGMGAQRLHRIEASFSTPHGVSDHASGHFGVREVTSELTSRAARLFKINGRNLLIRGGGWTPDMLLRPNPARMQAELDYVRHLGLNTIRLEGKLENDEFFDQTDRMGILVLAGWCCCDHWEHWDKWSAADHGIAKESLASQIRRLRTHPSAMAWFNGSDGPPPADVESEYIGVLQQCRWPNPHISSASATPTKVTGQSGVKMTGPYDYVPPDYWLRDPGTWGGAWGFNTETSPGPAIPVEESLRKFLPEERLWPRADNALWNYHAGLSRFTQTKIYDDALTATYGAPKDLADYQRKSQAMAYDAERAMFEAYGRNKYEATGVVQWMLNNAWPSIIWHLYDYYLQPAGGYFGTRKALEPIHVQYSYDDGGVQLVNSTPEALTGIKVTATAYTLAGTEKFSRQAGTNVAPDGTVRLLSVPTSADAAYFLKLIASDSTGKLVSQNFYWIAAQPTDFDWEHSDGRATPARHPQDLTALQQLPATNIGVIGHLRHSGKDGRVALTLDNRGSAVAFLLRAQVQAKCGAQTFHEVLPVLWDDNYISLLPQETRTVTATFDIADAMHPHRMDAGAMPVASPPSAKSCQFVAVTSGWNVPEQRMTLGPKQP